jgi:transcriptional regulator with XRE-family HTH domain
MSTKKRWPRGIWMTLTNPEGLAELMTMKDFSGARLARYAGCSRQFISQLTRGEKKTCTPKLAVLIAEALGVPVTVLFAPSVSSSTGRSGKSLVAA